MTTTSAAWTEDIIEAADHALHVRKGGEGPPLLLLHGEMGDPGGLRFYDALAQHHTVTLTHHPGFGKTARVDWVNNMRDLASWYLEALDDLALGPVPVVGLGLGGWLAAEMAVMCPPHFSQLIISGAPGIRPPEGEIFDMFLVVAKDSVDKGFYDPSATPEYEDLYGGELAPELLETWFNAREECSRLAWRPFMHDMTLPQRLHRLKRVPTLVVWGREDEIVPVSASGSYQAAIPGSRLALLDQCGHYPEIEQTDALVQLITDFIGADA